MKKLALTIVTTLAVAGAAFAQGTIQWSAAGFVPTFIGASTNSAAYSPLFGGGSAVGGATGLTASVNRGYYYELLYNTSFTGGAIASPSLAALTGGSWIDSGLGATNTGTAGRILPTASSTQASVASWAGGIGTLGGTTNNIILVGWSANLGTSWSTVETVLANWATDQGSIVGNAFFGMTSTGYIVPNAGNPGVTVFSNVSTVNGLPIFSANTVLYLLPVPEPSTLALAGLGGLSLLLFRRRK